MRWLKTKLDVFKDDAECEKLSASVYRKQRFNEPDPCYLVPAFSGLFCPWWQESARCVICGITANVDKSDLVYAGLRSSVYQTYDVLFVATLAKANNKCNSIVPLMALKKPNEIIVDGGMSNSDILMQSLADILSRFDQFYHYYYYFTQHAGNKLIHHFISTLYNLKLGICIGLLNQNIIKQEFSSNYIYIMFTIVI